MDALTSLLGGIAERALCSSLLNPNVDAVPLATIKFSPCKIRLFSSCAQLQATVYSDAIKHKIRQHRFRSFQLAGSSFARTLTAWTSVLSLVVHRARAATSAYKPQRAVTSVESALVVRAPRVRRRCAARQRRRRAGHEAALSKLNFQRSNPKWQQQQSR